MNKKWAFALIEILFIILVILFWDDVIGIMNLTPTSTPTSTPTNTPTNTSTSTPTTSPSATNTYSIDCCGMPTFTPKPIDPNATNTSVPLPSNTPIPYVPTNT